MRKIERWRFLGIIIVALWKRRGDGRVGGGGGSGPSSLLIYWDKMLMMLSVVWTHGGKVINIGLVLGFVVLASGLNTH